MRWNATTWTWGLLLAGLLVATPVLGQDTTAAKRPVPPRHAPHFVDRDGDGYDDNAPDHDGDGIPNGVDADYTGPRRGMRAFVDADADGYNDNAPDHDGDGIPNGIDPDFVRPHRGHGRGAAVQPGRPNRPPGAGRCGGGGRRGGRGN